MSKSKATDVLIGPEIQRHTQRILELQKEERQAQEEMGRIVAGIGAELIASRRRSTRPRTGPPGNAG